jgi:hypothetical protein
MMVHGNMTERFGGAALALLSLLCAGSPAAAGVKKPAGYALLVGCTEYKNVPIPELHGPANDVPMFARMLRDDFGFPPTNIRTLVGWPEDAARRPTHANIARGFEWLIASAGPDAQVVIFLAGHGVQVPIPDRQEDPLDPRNPELDGMDEVFLPADVRKWARGDLQNALRDDQINVWLQRLREKGANVWMIFDCCHSGTMARAADGERPRQVRPQDLGIPAEAIKRAGERRGVSPPVSERISSAAVHPLQVAPSRGGRGSVAVYYASQPFETTPELPRPAGAEAVPENYYGLFSWMLLATLKQRGKALSYRELAQLLVARYHAERRTLGPTPCFEGDLDREVLGLREWPGRSAIVLSRRRAGLSINAGQLHGIAPGSMLAVYPPAGGARSENTLLGHVKVTAAGPSSAVVVPTVYQKRDAPDADALFVGSRCKLVARDLGDMRVRVAVRPATVKDAVAKERVAASLRQLPKDQEELFTLTADEARADWLLTVEGERVNWQVAGAEPTPQHLVNYPIGDAKKLAQQLGRDIRRIYTWHNVWRVAGLASTDGKDDFGLRLEVTKLGKSDAPAGSLVSGEPLRPGQRLAYRLVNNSYQHLWVTVLLLDGSLGIKVESLPLRSKATFGPVKGTITGDGSGREGLVVLAVSQDVSREQPDYSFLRQHGFGGRAPADRDAARAPETPFGRLLAGAAGGRGYHSYEPAAPSNPVILSRSWFTLAP